MSIADDRRRSGEVGAGDRRVADPAAPEHGDGLAACHPAGVDRRPEAGHHATAEQPGNGGRRRGVDLRALAGRDECLVGEGADPQGGGQLRAILQGHLLAGVERVEAVPRLTAPAGAALAAHRPPVEDHEVTRGDVRDAVADLLDDPCGLVPEQEREVVVDPALAVVQVGVAHPARLDLDDRLARPRIGNDDRSRWLTGSPLALATTPRTVCGMGVNLIGPPIWGRSVSGPDTERPQIVS